MKRPTNSITSNTQQAPGAGQPDMIEQLSRIDGIDVERALIAMSGQVKLYLKLIKSFTIEQQQKAAELTHLYQTGQFETLNRRAHSLKTYAAYIGAYAVSSSSAELESMTNHNHSDKTLVDKTSRLLDDLLAQLLPLCPIENQTTANPEQAHFSTAEFNQLLHALIPLLIQSNAAAEDILPTLYNMSRRTPFETAIETIMAYVEEIEFEAAAGLAQKLLSQLER